MSLPLHSAGQSFPPQIPLSPKYSVDCHYGQKSELEILFPRLLIQQTCHNMFIFQLRLRPSLLSGRLHASPWSIIIHTDRHFPPNRIYINKLRSMLVSHLSFGTPSTLDSCLLDTDAAVCVSCVIHSRTLGVEYLSDRHQDN